MTTHPPASFRTFPTLLLLGLLFSSCAAPTPTQVATPLPTVTSPPPTATLTATPTIPTIEVDGLQIPDPKLTNPEFFDQTNPYSPIVQFANAFGVKPEDVGELLPELLTDVNGKPFVVLTTSDLAITSSFDETGSPLLVAEQGESGDWTWSQPSLKMLAQRRGILYGAEGLDGGNDARKFEILNQQFSQMTITGLSWRRSQLSEKEYDFTIPQAYLQKALVSYQVPTFQHLVYGNSTDTPDWLIDGHYSREDAIQIMQDHITQVMVSNKAFVNDLMRNGTILEDSRIRLQYVVVNEGVNEPSYYWPRKIGSDYIELAFRAARAADPDAVLLYNDFGHELPLTKNANAVFAVVQKLSDQGLIDGVGMQMHFLGGSDNLDPNLEIGDLEKGIRSQIDRYAQIGVRVYITELDVDLSQINADTPTKMQKAANLYRLIARVCASSSNCAGVSVFGVNSESSWITDLGGQPALLFANNEPLPTFFATLAGLVDATR